MAVGTGGCPGKTSVILSSVLSHHRTNELMGGGGGMSYLLLLPDHYCPLRLTTSPRGLKVREQICQIQIKY